MSPKPTTFLCILEDHGVVEEVDSAWETRTACSSSCRKYWWMGCPSCCPPPARPEMKSSLWSKLPQELLETVVLPRLPAASQARFKAVCGKWYHLLSSLKLVHQSALQAVSSGRAPCFVWNGAKGGFSHVRKRFKTLQVLVPGGAKSYRQSWQNGLLCLYKIHARDPVSLDICVVNPVNRTWIELPHLETPSQYQRILVLPDSSGSSFRVVVRSIKLCEDTDEEVDDEEVDDRHPPDICDLCRVWSFDIYRSETGVWSETTYAEYDPPPIDNGNFCPSLSMQFEPHLLHNGLLYVVLSDPGDLLILSADDGRFVRRLTGLGGGGVDGWIKRDPAQLWTKNEELVGHQGNVYCVACPNHTCAIWKLDESSSRWLHVSEYAWMGPHVKEPVGLELLSAVVVSNRVYIAFRLRDVWGARLLAYDIGHNTWKTISYDNDFANELFVPLPSFRLGCDM